MAYNRRESRKAGSSWAAKNLAGFQAQPRAFANKCDAFMTGNGDRNASSDKPQERDIDGIYARTNAADNSTGQRYKVAAGAINYWMNGDGGYIRSDQQGYNPNSSENMIAQGWQELQKAE